MTEAYEKRCNELDELAADYAKAEAERSYLEEFKKSKLAILMKEAETKGFKAISAQEREARASDTYIELLQGLRVATEEAEKTKWFLKNAHMKAGLYQTRQATERAKMTMR